MEPNHDEKAQVQLIIKPAQLICQLVQKLLSRDLKLFCIFRYFSPLIPHQSLFMRF